MNTIHHILFQIKQVVFTPDTCNCPYCNAMSKRHSKANRMVIDIDLCVLVLLYCQVGVYKCTNKDCPGPHRFFRIELPFAPKGGKYTYRAMEKCIASVREDNMAFATVPHRMQRDFNIKPSISTVHRWYHQQAEQLDLFYDYHQWVVDSFSGVLCIDEVYDNGIGVIVATDPLNQKTVAYSVEHQITEAEMTRFFNYLKQLGIDPEVITTDGSPLYPGVMCQVFSHSKQQLCLFHVMQNINKDILKGVLAYRRSLPKPHKKKGRPRNGETPVYDITIDLFKRRYLVVTRPEHLNKEEILLLGDFMFEHQILQLYRNFILDVFDMFDQQTTQDAQHKRDEIFKNPEYLQDQYINNALKRLQQDKFDNMITFMDYENLNATNNDAERAARNFRRLQNSHYRLRKNYTIENMLKHELIRQKVNHNKTEQHLKPKDKLQTIPKAA